MILSNNRALIPFFHNDTVQLDAITQKDILDKKYVNYQ